MHETKSINHSLVTSIVGVMQCDSGVFKDLISAGGLDPERGEISDIDLSDVDLSGQDLSNLDLSEACFENTGLNQTDLRDAKVDQIEIQFSKDYTNAKIDQPLLKKIEATRIETVLLMPITDGDFSIRTQKCLEGEAINFFGQLVQLKERELLHIPNFGRKSLSELRKAFVSMELSFEMELPDNLQERFPRPKSPNFGFEEYMTERFGENYLYKSYFIKNLQEVRLCIGLRQIDFAARSNLSIDSIRKYEKQRTNFGIRGNLMCRLISVLGRFANDLEVTTNY